MTDHIPYSVALRQQPSSLELAVQSIRNSVARATPAPWLAGETVAIISMGASGHSANALVAALTAAGVRSVNLTASDLFDAAPGFEPGDHYLIVSESGRSPEPLRAAAQLGAARGTRIGITNRAKAPIAEVVDTTISLGGFDDSPVYTVGYIATLVAYSVLLRATGHEAQAIDEARVPQLVAEAIIEYEPIASTLAAHLSDVASLDCVGRGYSYAAAAQSALMIREAVRIPTAGYETYQYLHGPMESGRRGTGLLVFGDGRELPMIASQLEAGVRVLLVTAASDEQLDAIAHENLLVVRLPRAEEGIARAVVEVVVVQLLTEAMAAARAITIEEFLYEQDDTKMKEAAHP